MSLTPVIARRPSGPTRQSDVIHRPERIEGSPNNSEVLRQAQDDLLKASQIASSAFGVIAVTDTLESSNFI